MAKEALAFVRVFRVLPWQKPKPLTATRLAASLVGLRCANPTYTFCFRVLPWPKINTAYRDKAGRHRAGRTLRFCPVVALRGDLPDNPASITDARAGRTLLDTGQRRDARAAVS
ncbi:hypothetical protein [Vogesella indigofera]|uniref:hypothetical protein n=1 Tax=Vogesella indigofera TaxID=45465 RepID=UPI0011C4258C|nr:hypothetical protein [Vogesella indigofera]